MQKQAIQVVDRRGRYPLYQAKVGTMSGSLIMVRRARKFYVGQRIQFAELQDTEGMSVAMAPRWRNGIIWLLENDRIFVNLN